MHQNSESRENSLSTEKQSDLEVVKPLDWARIDALKDCIMGSSRRALKLLQQEVLCLDLNGQKEFQAFLTQLLLWTDDKSRLYHNILIYIVYERISQSTGIVIRKVLLEASRLSKLQQRMVDANCIRRARFLKARKHYEQLRSEGVERPQAKEDGVSLGDCRPIEAGLGRITTQSTFTSTYVQPSRLVTTPGTNRDYPELPRLREEAHAIECPLCFQRLSPSVLGSTTRWRYVYLS